MGMQYEHSARTRSIDVRHGHATRTCSIDMRNIVDVDMPYGHARWTYSMDMATSLGSETKKYVLPMTICQFI
jgi:hypothetical protein